ncbi:unnamed protein product [marine sediment metagenome]|uniref:Uncharacterized protein n=1 Tax=marine sediment metagenome TaxID=412755 RepID=X1LXV6_9ZZZZ
MPKNQSINVVIRFTHVPHRGAGFIGQALRMLNKLSDYNNMLNKLSDYNNMLNKSRSFTKGLDKLSDYNINILIEYCKRDLNHA